MALDISKLQNVVKSTNGEIQARCPACAAVGLDTKSEHLKVFTDGKYACASNQGDSEHRKEIFQLVGIPSGGAARVGQISVNTFKVQESTVVMDLSTFPRFSRVRGKPKVASKDFDATKPVDGETTAAP